MLLSSFPVLINTQVSERSWYWT